MALGWLSEDSSPSVSGGQSLKACRRGWGYLTEAGVRGRWGINSEQKGVSIHRQKGPLVCSLHVSVFGGFCCLCEDIR